MKKNVIGKQISFLRSKYGMTQEELGIKLGVSKQTISNWETGLKTPRMGSIQKLAALFNVKKSFIIEGVEDNTEEILNIYEKLNEQRKNEVVDFAKFKLQEQNKENEKKSKESNIKKFHPAKNNAEDETTETDDPYAVFAAHIDDDATEEEMEEIMAYLKEIKKGKK